MMFAKELESFLEFFIACYIDVTCVFSIFSISLLSFIVFFPFVSIPLCKKREGKIENNEGMKFIQLTEFFHKKTRF